MTMRFWNMHLHTQALVMAFVAAWDDKEKMLRLIRDIVGKPFGNDIKFVQDKWDSFFVAEYAEVAWIGFCGTRSNWAWASDFMAWWKKGYHYGIANSMDSLFAPSSGSLRRDTSVRLAGQSRGGADALYANMLLKRLGGFADVESIGICSPYIAAPAGMAELKKLNIRHTNVFRDKYDDIGNQRDALPSDPTNNVGVFRGKHYGMCIDVGGSEGPFSHGYYSTLNAYVVMYHEWGWHEDAEYLSSIRKLICKK
jgi:hypothetical protein